MKNHEEAFHDMKEYYNDITRENLEMIRGYKERLVEIKNQIDQNVLMIEQLKEERLKLEKPLKLANDRREILKKQLGNFPKDQMAKRNCKARLRYLKEE
jgi:hypothetical protein